MSRSAPVIARRVGRLSTNSKSPSTNRRGPPSSATALPTRSVSPLFSVDEQGFTLELRGWLQKRLWALMVLAEGQVRPCTRRPVETEGNPACMRRGQSECGSIRRARINEKAATTVATVHRRTSHSTCWQSRGGAQSQLPLARAEQTKAKMCQGARRSPSMNSRSRRSYASGQK